LILGQRLGGIDQQSRRPRFDQNPLDDGYLKAERFARGGPRSKHYMPAGSDVVDRLDLMPV
jgi:hypothetical protein